MVEKLIEMIDRLTDNGCYDWAEKLSDIEWKWGRTFSDKIWKEIREYYEDQIAGYEEMQRMRRDYYTW